MATKPIQKAENNSLICIGQNTSFFEWSKALRYMNGHVEGHQKQNGCQHHLKT
jgi:hypothetical protein